MNDPIFTGVGVALVTLFTTAGDLDAGATADHAARLVDLGVRAVVVAGTTGEAAALEREERVELLAAVRRAIPEGRAAVIAGTGAPSARQAAGLTVAAGDNGADSVLVLSPPGAPDPREYYEVVAKAARGMPVLAYHFPAVSSPGIPAATLAELPIAGCKDSSGDPDRLLETLARWRGQLYVGSSALLTMAGLMGCTGAILALANAEPELCISAFAGDANSQKALAQAHASAHQAFPSGIKTLTARRFETSATARLGV